MFDAWLGIVAFLQKFGYYVPVSGPDTVKVTLSGHWQDPRNCNRLGEENACLCFPFYFSGVDPTVSSKFITHLQAECEHMKAKIK